VANDLTFNVIAFDRATTALMSVADKLEVVENRLRSIDGKTVTADVNVRTDDSRKSLDSFTSRFQLMAAGIIAGSPAIGAAVIGGIGAGFIGAAVAAQKSNQDIQRTYQAMWANVVGQTRSATSQLVPQIVAAGRQIDATVNRLGPQMQQAFSAAGPDIAALTRGVTTFATNAMPGVTSAMQSSLPVFTAVADVMGILGTASGAMAASFGQNAQIYATFMRSIGSITATVMATVTNIVNDVAQIWAENSAEINSAINGVGDVISDLATGAVPILSAALDVAATSLNTITQILGPVAPILGTVATGALAVWAAFKVFALASAAITTLGGSIGLAGTAMGVASVDAAKLVGGLSGVTVASAAAARGLQAAGLAAGQAAVGFGAAMRTFAGPIAIALMAVAAGMALFSSSSDDAGSSARGTAVAVDELTSALQKSKGAWDQAAVDQVKSTKEFKEAAAAAAEFGISQEELLRLIKEGGWDAVIGRLQRLAGATEDLDSKTFRLSSVTGGAVKDTVNFGERAGAAAGKIGALKSAVEGSAMAASVNSAATAKAASEITASGQAQALATSYAQAFGVALTTVQGAFVGLAGQAGNAGNSVDQIATKFRDGQIKILNAGQAIANTFKQADQSVVNARNAVSDASHSYAASQRSVADAQHSAAAAARAVGDAEQGVAEARHGVESAQRAVKDAIEGVTNAQKAYVRSQEQARDAEVSLHEARRQALQDLKELKLAMEDQVVSEESARVRVFETQQKAAELGVTPGNAVAIAATPVTAENLDQVKAAIDLRSAQNALNNTMNSGVKLREQVAEADRLGVEGARGVVSANRQLRDAQQQVADAAKGVQRAQQQVADANYGLQQANRGLQRAHQAVADAAYGEQRAHQAVTDAQYASERSAGQLQRAKESLTEAEANASRTFDLSTEAGRRNFEQLKTLADAISAVYGPTAQGYNSLIQETANKFGISTEKAEEYLRQLGLIPPNFKFGVTAVPSIDAQGLWDDIKAPTSLTGRKQAFAAGGQIFGPGGPRDDKIPAWLSNREYVHPVDAVDHYGVGFMEAVRTKQFPKGWDGAAAPRFADGGMVGMATANLALTDVGARYQATVHALDVLGWEHPPLLPKYVPPPVPVFTGSAGVNQWAPLVLQVLSMLGLPADILPKVLRRMNQESGGNPTAYNNWDVNARNGIPSQGLMQTVPPTFAAYAGPFRDRGIMDPLASIYAGINYAGHKYGGGHGGFLGGVIYGMDKPGGYDNGGPLPPGLSMVYNGTGKPENVRTSEQEDKLLAAVQGLRTELKTVMYENGRGRWEGTLRLADGALVGQVEATIKRAETLSGMLR